MLFIGKLLPPGTEIKIEVGNKLMYRFSLEQDRSIKIDHMVIEIRNKKVRVADADCPNKLCVKQGWIDRGAIVCLPNRIIIFVVNPSVKEDKVDAITG